MSHDPETHTPRLEAFLDGGRLRRLTSREVQEWMADVFEAARAADDLELNPDHHGYRVMALWRIVRCMAMTVGLCSGDELLEDAIETMVPSPWATPIRPISADPEAVDGVPMTAAAQRKVWALCNASGLQLLPPSTISHRKDPMALSAWVIAANIIAKSVGLANTEIGLAGIQGLLEGDGALRCDVTSEEVIRFEDMIVSEVQDLYLDKGERLTLRHLRDEYDIKRKEAMALLRLSKTLAFKQTQASVEEKRALQERRLENYLARCKETLDMAGEMVAMKELSKIQGLTRVDPENMALEFMDTVSRVAKEQDGKNLDAATRMLIDGQAEQPKTIEAFTNKLEGVAAPEPAAADPDDAEALAEFDRESRK